jgi:hypothetical protein
MLHVQLRDKPRLGHIWVTQLEAIDVEFTDGGPPKLKEWQIPEGDVDASHIELPWRVPRRVLEMSGAHEAEKRGDFVCAARLDRSQLPDLPVRCHVRIAGTRGRAVNRAATHRIRRWL